MTCIGCKKPIDREEYVEMNHLPEVCSQGYRFLNKSYTLNYCIKCAEDMKRYIYEKYASK